MVFYKGALSYETLQNLTYAELQQLNSQAKRINDERRKAKDKGGR